MEETKKQLPEMRICARSSCGIILEPQQQLYCSRNCYSIDKSGKKRKRHQPEVETFPTWTCDNGCVVQLKFSPAKERNKFDNYIKNHQCQHQKQENKKEKI